MSKKNPKYQLTTNGLLCTNSGDDDLDRLKSTALLLKSLFFRDYEVIRGGVEIWSTEGRLLHD